MTLPVTLPNASGLYDSLRDAGVNVASYMTTISAKIVSGPVESTYFLSALSKAVATLAQAQQLQQTLGANAGLSASMVAYVQNESGNPTLDVAAALDASVSALGALISAMVADFPKDGSGRLLDRSFAADGSVVFASLPGSALPNTSAAITAWLATIS